MSTSLYRQIDCLIGRLYEFYVKKKQKKKIVEFFYIFKRSSGNEKNTRRLLCIPMSNINYYWVQNNRRIEDGIQKQRLVYTRKILYRLCVCVCVLVLFLFFIEKCIHESTLNFCIVFNFGRWAFVF